MWTPRRHRQPHRCPPHHRDWPAQYRAARSPSPPPPQTGHGRPETPPPTPRHETPAPTTPPARPARSSSASTPPWHQTPTARPPTAEYEHPTNSSHFLSLRLLRLIHNAVRQLRFPPSPSAGRSSSQLPGTIGIRGPSPNSSPASVANPA